MYNKANAMQASRMVHRTSYIVNRKLIYGNLITCPIDA